MQSMIKKCCRLLIISVFLVSTVPLHSLGLWKKISRSTHAKDKHHTQKSMPELFASAHGSCTLHPTTKNMWDLDANGYLLWMTQDLQSTANKETINFIEKNYDKNIKKILSKNLFTGAREQTFTLTVERNKNLVQLIFIGLGALTGQPHIEREHLRRALCSAIHTVKKL